MKTFRKYVETRLTESFGFESAVDVYKRLGGDGKRSVEYPGMPGWYIHPNGIVSPDMPAGEEHMPIFDPYHQDAAKGYFGNVAPVPER